MKEIRFLKYIPSVIEKPGRHQKPFLKWPIKAYNNAKSK